MVLKTRTLYVRPSGHTAIFKGNCYQDESQSLFSATQPDLQIVGEVSHAYRVRVAYADSL